MVWNMAVLILFGAFFIGLSFVYWVRPPVPKGIGRGVSSVLAGIFFTGWIGYGSAVLGTRSGYPLAIAGIVILGTAAFAVRDLVRHRAGIRRYYAVDLHDICVLVILTGISVWLMTKTVGMLSNGIPFVGSHLVYDLGQNIGIVRSFSRGQNVPFLSPFIAGTPFPYHFLFYFLAGLLEYWGFRLDIAVNAISVIAMTGLLTAVYLLPGAVCGIRMRGAGLVAVLLSLTNSTLTALYVLNRPWTREFFRSLWQRHEYYFSHPYDGSDISVFWTLDTYVNQRHLVFAAAVFLFLTMTVLTMVRSRRYPDRTLVAVGLMAGGLPLFHAQAFAAACAVLFFMFVTARAWRPLYRAGIISILCAIPQLLFLYLASWGRPGVTESSAIHTWLASVSVPSVLRYWADNFGILTAAVAGGMLFIAGARRFLGPLAALIFLAFVGNRGIEVGHKYMVLAILIGNGIAALGMSRLWRTPMGKVAAVAVCLLMTVSGMLSLPVIKNEFRYPITSESGNRLIEFLSTHTPGSAVILAEPEVFDPVVLAGRRNYYGLYRRNAYPERERDVRTFIEHPESAAAGARGRGITHIAVRKGIMRESPYRINVTRTDPSFLKLYDDGYQLYEVSVLE